MTPNLGTIQTMRCVNTAPAPDFNCDDPAFALANPDKCPPEQLFIIKPGIAILCELGSVKFRAFTVINGVETDVTAETVFTSSDQTIVMVSATTGDATGINSGEATITATYAGFTAQTVATVLEGADCCDDETVAFMVLVDQTKSMQQVFGSGYINKLAYAKAAATALIESINENKDSVGLARFTKDATVVLATPTADKDAVAALVPGIAQTTIDTEFYDAIGSAIAALDLITADRKVLVIISDGEDTADSYEDENPIQLTNDFKAAGGIVVCLGVRSHDAGYSLLSAFTTGGFFINAYQATSSISLDYLIGLKGYLCGGNCIEDGDVNDYRGALNYSTLNNWECAFDFDANNGMGNSVLEFGINKLDPIAPSILDEDVAVDLIGNGFFDVLPGNGLYLDLWPDWVGGVQKSSPMLISKDKFTLTAGDEYRIAVKLAGSQFIGINGSANPQVTVGLWDVVTGAAIFQQDITVNDFTQDFTSYGFTFTAPVANDVRIVIFHFAGGTPDVNNPTIFHGALLGEVLLEKIGGAILLFDNFDTENPTYVGPKCGYGATYTEIGLSQELVDFVETPTFIPPIIALVEDISGNMVIEGFAEGETYWFTYVTADGETLNSAGFSFTYDDMIPPLNAAKITTPTDVPVGVISKRIYKSTTVDFSVRMIAELSPEIADYVDTLSQAEWNALATSLPLLPTENTTGHYEWASVYGYAYGYNCYGDGCLDTPPISQKQDPYPLPNLELGTTPGLFTSTQQGCAPACPAGYVDIGQPLTATQLPTGAEYETIIQLATAAGIKRWEVTFNREWNPNAPGLTLEGSNDGSSWTTLDTQSTALSGVSGSTLRYTLTDESDAYEYYRASMADGDPTDDGKVFDLQVYPTPAYPVCKTASAQGATAAQAIANALQAAINAAIAEQNCVEEFSATEVYVAPGGATGSAAASSLNTEQEAQTIAAAEAQANAV